MYSASQLQELLEYCALTGNFRWKERGAHWFQDAKIMKMWNKKWAGKPALNARHNAGYKYGNLLNTPTLAHRVAWVMATGEIPDEIDHINGDRSDNRLTNLRAVSRSQNRKNTKLPITNTSGHLGVRWVENKQKWQARIQVDKREKHLGYFGTIEAAINARACANKMYGFHANHGRK